MRAKLEVKTRRTFSVSMCKAFDLNANFEDRAMFENIMSQEKPKKLSTKVINENSAIFFVAASASAVAVVVVVFVELLFSRADARTSKSLFLAFFLYNIKNRHTFLWIAFH